ncbi:flagellar protein FlaG [Paenibacillus crassostreae]|nr:flagellar protein FlaG [Paenibacillus crassostreae]
MDNRIMSGNPIVMGNRNVSSTKSSNEDVVVSPVASSSEPAKVSVSLSGENEKQIVQQLEKVIEAVQGPEKSFEISVHKDTNAIMVKVFNKQTGDLIREIPSEKILDVAANMMKLNGLIVDDKV